MAANRQTYIHTYIHTHVRKGSHASVGLALARPNKPLNLAGINCDPLSQDILHPRKSGTPSVQYFRHSLPIILGQ